MKLLNCLPNRALSFAESLRCALCVCLTSLCLSPAFAFAQNLQQPQPITPFQAPSFGEILGKMSPMLIMVFFIFYFLVVRPQAKKLEEQNKLLNELAKGDTVVTSSGIIAKVFGVEPDSVTLEVAQAVKIKFEKTAILKKI